MSTQPKTPEQIAEVADNLAKVQSFDPWSAKWISEAHMLLRSLASQPAEKPSGEVLDAPAKVGAVVFNKGVLWSSVVACAQRAYVYKDQLDLTPEQTAAFRQAVQPKPEQATTEDSSAVREQAGEGFFERLAANSPKQFQPKPEQDHSRDATKMIEQAIGDGVLSGKYGDVLRPFLALMDRELHANAGKGDRPGWLAMDRKTALLEIFYHLAKLQKAAKDDDQERIREYGADVANMAMMLVDVCGALHSTPSLAPVEVGDGVVALPPIVREVLEWYASAPSIWVAWNEAGWAEEEAAKASGHYTFIGEDNRGHNQYMPNEVRAQEALDALTEWQESLPRPAVATPAEEGLKLDPDTNECSPDPVVRKAFADGYDQGFVHGSGATPAEVTDVAIKRYRVRIVPDITALDGVVADTVEDARGDLVTYADHCAALASPSAGAVVPEGWLHALDAAVSAIYFDDSSKYLRALWTVVRSLRPDIADRLERYQPDAYDEVQAMLASASEVP